MAVAKTIEIVAASPTSVEDAVKTGIAKVAETVKGIEGAWIKDTEALVKDGAVTEWRVTLAVTFVVD